MTIILSLLPAGFAILVLGYLLRGLYRFFFRKQILERLQRSAQVKEIDVINDAIKSNDYTRFEREVTEADTAHLNAVNWDKDALALLNTRVMVERYERENSSSARAHLIAGTYATYAAWEARGSGYASTVSHESFKQFDELLQEAKSSLHKALELDRELIPAHAGLLQVYKGLGDDSAAAQTFSAAKKIAPSNLSYHLTRLDHLNAKWGGSDEKMFAFARTNAEADETGVLNGLIAAAHQGVWMSLEQDAAKKYFSQTAVRKELLEAAKPLLKFRVPFTTEKDKQRLLALNYLAFALSMANRRRHARKAFKRIGSQWTTAPWNSLSYEQPAKAFLTHKRWAGA